MLWSSACVKCTESNPGFAVLLIGFNILYVFMQYEFSQSSSGRTKGELSTADTRLLTCCLLLTVFFYFLSTCMLMLGDFASWCATNHSRERCS